MRKIWFEMCVHLVVTGLVKTAEEDECWNYYMANMLSIEILKDDQVQKIYFRVKDKVSKWRDTAVCGDTT